MKKKKRHVEEEKQKLDENEDDEKDSEEKEKVVFPSSSFFATEKLVVVGEPVDAYYYDPTVIKPIKLPLAPKLLQWKVDSTIDSSRTETSFDLSKNYKFFSAFKWESRKGWEILLEAYFDEFILFDQQQQQQNHQVVPTTEPVSLYISSYLYGDDSRDPKKLMEFVKQIALKVLLEKVVKLVEAGEDDTLTSAKWRTTLNRKHRSTKNKIVPGQARFERNFYPKSGRFAPSQKEQQELYFDEDLIISEEERQEQEVSREGNENQQEHLLSKLIRLLKDQNSKTNQKKVSIEQKQKLQDFFERNWRSLVPHVEIISEKLPEKRLVELYRSVDAFVLPTRGEGWGLPAIQAMSMGLPVLLTNWSGNVDFMMSSKSLLRHHKQKQHVTVVQPGEICYPIRLQKLEQVESDNNNEDDEERSKNRGKDWAVPDVKHLKELMREVFTFPDAARERGARGRSFIVSQYSDEGMAELVARRVEYLMEKKMKN